MPMKQPDAAVDTISKEALRQQALGRRNALSNAVRTAASASIAERAGELLESLQPESVSFYLPIGSECDTGALIAKADSIGAAISLPAIVNRTTLLFRRYHPGDPLVDAAFGTREPSNNAPTLWPQLIVTPLIAFDRNGTRLGYGRGHYDRAINIMREAGQRPKLIGIAFSVQEVALIPAEPHDARLDWIVTENGSVKFEKNKD